MITVSEKELSIEKQMAEGQLDASTGQTQLDAVKDEYPDDLIDDLCLILDKSIKRVSALISLSNQFLLFTVLVHTFNGKCVCSAKLYS